MTLWAQSSSEDTNSLPDLGSRTAPVSELLTDLCFPRNKQNLMWSVTSEIISLLVFLPASHYIILISRFDHNFRISSVHRSLPFSRMLCQATNQLCAVKQHNETLKTAYDCKGRAERSHPVPRLRLTLPRQCYSSISMLPGGAGLYCFILQHPCSQVCPAHLVPGHCKQVLFGKRGICLPGRLVKWWIYSALSFI